MRLVIVELAGTDRERGRTHGAELRTAIQERLSTVFAKRFPGWARRDILDVLAPRAAVFERQLARIGPHLLEEIRGIAEGAAVTDLETLVLSAFEAINPASQAADHGCTAIGVRRRAQSVIGQNWDATEEHSRYLVGLHVTLPDRTRQLLLASAGGLGWCGMNSHGLAVVNNDLVLRSTRVAPPSQALRRLLLERKTVEDCVRFLTAVPSPGGRSYVIGDRDGSLAAIEVSALHPPQVVRSDHAVWHTNHAESELVRADEDTSALAMSYPSSVARGRRAAELLSISRTQPLDTVTAVLRDHSDYPRSICKHPSDDEPSATGASVVFDLSGGVGHFTIAAPCQQPSTALLV